MALKILLTVAMALILSLESTAAILPQSPGNSGTVDVRFPVPKYYQQYATQDGNPVPTTGRLFLLLPPNFDSRRVWPILIVTATKDPGHTAPSDVPWYQAAAAAEGWIVLATDGDGPPSKRLSKLETRASGGRAGRGASRMAKVGPMAGGVCWHLGRRAVRAMAWSDPGPDALLEHTRVFPQRN